MSDVPVETPNQVFERLLSQIKALREETERLADQIAFTALCVMAAEMDPTDSVGDDV